MTPDFVFVNEHDRQKRLKGTFRSILATATHPANSPSVMRACEACRKRKIKCDAVTTNSWPCTKCQRSNLDCVPPSTDGALATDGSYFDGSIEGEPLPTPHHQPAAPDAHPGYGWASANTSPVHTRANADYAFPITPISANPATASHPQFPSAAYERTYPESRYEPVHTTEYGSYSQFSQTRADSAPLASSVSDEAWRASSPDGDLAGHLGDLQIDGAAVGKRSSPHRVTLPPC